MTQTFYHRAGVLQAVLVWSSARASATLVASPRLSGAKGELMTLLMLAPALLPMYVAAAVLYTDTFSGFIMVALDSIRAHRAKPGGAARAVRCLRRGGADRLPDQNDGAHRADGGRDRLAAGDEAGARDALHGALRGDCRGGTAAVQHYMKTRCSTRRWSRSTTRPRFTGL